MGVSIKKLGIGVSETLCIYKKGLNTHTICGRKSLNTHSIF